jgi:2-dehydro-3-deoxyphosphogluconate aldolase/(4S)-4-hydroxy-2-oxoglutarate aldolase
MVSRDEAMARVEEAGLIVVIRLKDPARVGPVVDALASAGVSIIEITMTVPGALGLISKHGKGIEGCLVGAGTVTGPETARDALDAGADFLVSPVLDDGVMAVAGEGGAACIPGVFTASEAFRAVQLGAAAIKLFPARSVGPAYVRDLLGPLPDLRIIPAGGVNAENAASYIEAGSPAVFSGSSLVNDRLAARDSLDEIETRARQMLSVIRKAKGGWSHEG